MPIQWTGYFAQNKEINLTDVDLIILSERKLKTYQCFLGFTIFQNVTISAPRIVG
jgi:hypothetical protein